MSPLEIFSETRLPVAWRTVLLGWEGPGKNSPQLVLDDVRRYASQRLADGESDEDIVSIAIAADDDSDKVRVKLKALAEREGSDASQEVRKWQVVMLFCLLDELPNDPLDGLLALMEFWAGFDFPSDGPLDLPAPGATDYYTHRNYVTVVQKHRSWLDRQIAAHARDNPEPH